jgi:transcriptional regulator GlxA family with amidase domain
VPGDFCAAYTGILDNRRAATHWEYEKSFQRLFPQITLDVNVLYTDDDGLITSAGTAAALDCCLYVIRQRFGASHVADQRAGWSLRRIAKAARRGTLNRWCRTIPAIIR